MKNTLLTFPKCILTVVLIGSIQIAGAIPAIAYATTPALHAIDTDRVSDQPEKRSVQSLLFELEKNYRVSFNYNDKIVRGVMLPEDFKWNSKEKLEEVLARLIAATDLNFEKVDPQNYYVFSEKEKRASRVPEATQDTPVSSASSDLFLTDTAAPVIDNFASKSQSIALQVTGVVKDENNGPLPGVNVLEKGTTNGTTTDAEGKFTLELPNGEAVIIFSFIGYRSQEVAVNDRTVLDISMMPDVASLEEVVVVGYGEQKRANVLGAVADIKAKDIEDFPVANLGTALVNRVPGVSVSQASGKPGAATQIVIRNTNTFAPITGVDPLYVIDGFQVAKEYFDNLDASQVESVTFLKDAAASIYGSQGANGVVLVKTKRGKAGKTKISYQGTYAISTETKFSDRLTGYQYAKLLNDYYASEPVDANVPASSYYTAEELEYLKHNRHNWLDEVWQDSHLQRHTLNVSGGSDAVTYYAGGNFYKETGNLRDLYVSKYSMRFGMNARVTKNLTADVSMSTDNSVKNRPSPKGVTVQSETLSETISSLLLMPEWIPMYHEGKAVYASNIQWHPYELQNSGTYARSQSKGMIINASLEYKVPAIKGLSFRVQYAKSTRTEFGKEYYASYDTYEFVTEGAHEGTAGTYGNPDVMYSDQVNKVWRIKNGNFLSESYGSQETYQLNEAITYKRTFGAHDVNLLLLAEQGEATGDNFDARREGQVISGIDQLFAFSADKANWDNSGSSNEGGRMSYLGRLNYAYRDKYLLESVFRADASPNFPTHSQWGYFPSVAVGWKISEEPFFSDNVSFVDDLKIRFQVGLTGNNNVPGYSYKERYTQTTGMLFGSTLTNGLSNNAIPNPNITWEKALYKNLGFDGTFFRQKFNFSVDLYQRENYDMFDTPTSTVPTTFGSAIASQNYGRLNSWGLEAAIGYNGVVRDFNYSIGVNLGATDNKVVRRFVSDSDRGTWKDPNGRRTDSGIEGFESLGIVRSQEKLDAFLAENPGYTIDGKVPEVGWVLFRDQNTIDSDGDGKYDAKDGLIDSNDKVRLKGRSGTRFNTGYNLGASWRGFRFSMNISLAIGGYDIYDKPARTIPNLKGTQSALSHWADAWSVNNPDGRYPKLDARMASEVYDLWIVSATVMRVNNMSLSYALPSVLQQKYNMPQVRVFLTGTNLWDIINHNPYKYSTTNLSTDYPALRTYSLGINIGL